MVLGSNICSILPASGSSSMCTVFLQSSTLKLSWMHTSQWQTHWRVPAVT